MEPIFKLAAPSDLETVIQLSHQLYSHEQLPFQEPGVRSALDLILANHNYGRVYLIYVGETIAGYLVVTFGFSLEFHGRDAIVDELYIEEPYRRQGIGKQSLQLAEQVCQEEGIKALHLFVERKNTYAQGVYRQAGYVDHDRYVLTKWLCNDGNDKGSQNEPSQ